MTLRRLALVAALAVLWLLGSALPASGHAALRATTPVDGAEIDALPSAVTLEFNEPVDVSPGALRVFNADGQRVDGGEIDHDGAIVATPLAGDLGEGTFVATWRAVSADGHPIQGAFVFTVGAADVAADSVLAQIAADTSDTGWQVAAAIGRFTLYAGALVGAGALIFMLRVHDRRASDRAVLVRITVAGAALAAASTIVGVGLQAALVTGLGARALVDPGVLGQTLASGYGLAAGIMLVGTLLLALGARRLWDGWAVGTATAGTVLVLCSFLFSGHTATADPRWVALVADVAHLFAAAAWLGGLVCLLIVMRRRRLEDDAVGGSALVKRFSGLATVAVAIVSAAGLGLAWVEVRAFRALFSTAYGWTLVAKLVAVGAILLIAGYNHRRLVPAVQAAGTDAWRRLRQTVRFEVGGILAVLVVTAVLVNLVPAREAAGITGPYATTVATSDGAHRVDITVDPNRAGENTMHFYLLGSNGQPTDAERFSVALSMPSNEIAAIEREPDRVAAGHWSMYDAELPITGRWMVTVTAQVGEFSDATAEIPVDVGA